MPPVISLDFIQPPPSGDFEEQVDRTEPTQIFQVTNFLDPNDAELLEVVWFRHDGTVSRLLTTESARRDTAQTGLHRGIFPLLHRVQLPPRALQHRVEGDQSSLADRAGRRRPGRLRRLPFCRADRRRGGVR